MPAARRFHVVALGLLLACGGGRESDTPPATSSAGSAETRTAFFYQDVSSTGNAVRVGVTTDGRTVEPYGVNVLEWQVLGGQTQVYGDPVFSRLANGRWAMTAWTGSADPRGGAALLYHESDCPRVSASAVHVLRPSSAAGCTAGSTLAMAKTSQVFAAEGGNYLFTMTGGRILLVRLTDATHAATELTSICVRSARPSSLTGLGWGEATVVVDESLAPGLLLSDTAIARRTDGTWVLFVKGIATNAGCTQGGLCELCGRRIYRTTSTDLLRWSSPTSVVEQASVPEAASFPDGSVHLYWQDFAPTCQAQDLNRAPRAPISGGTEGADGRLGSTTAVFFSGETFETDTRMHYPTNGNPVRLPDAAAANAFAACFGR